MRLLLTTIMLLLILTVLTVGCQTSDKPILQNPSETQNTIKKYARLLVNSHQVTFR